MRSFLFQTVVIEISTNINLSISVFVLHVTEEFHLLPNMVAYGKEFGPQYGRCLLRGISSSMTSYGGGFFILIRSLFVDGNSHLVWLCIERVFWNINLSLEMSRNDPIHYSWNTNGYIDTPFDVIHTSFDNMVIGTPLDTFTPSKWNCISSGVLPRHLPWLGYATGIFSCALCSAMCFQNHLLCALLYVLRKVGAMSPVTCFQK